MFSLPMHYNQKFIELAQSVDLASVYFSLPDSAVFDARVSNTTITPSVAIEWLRCLPPTVSTYTTLNGRWSPLTAYLEEECTQLMRQLVHLRTSVGLTGIIFLDMYLLKALAQLPPVDGVRLADFDCVPSVNCNLATSSSVWSMLRQLRTLGLAQPKKFILDRSYNRNWDELVELCRDLHAAGMNVEILVNEGCLPHCNFKINHDVAISMTNYSTHSPHAAPLAAQLNTELGCIHHLTNNPSDLLKIPFVLPQDLHHYNNHVDTFKISGKTRSTEWLARVVSAYQSQKWDGNLLALLDAASPNAATFHVFGDQLPSGFWHKLNRCGNKCHQCNYCDVVAATSIQRLASS